MLLKTVLGSRRPPGRPQRHTRAILTGLKVINVLATHEIKGKMARASEEKGEGMIMT